MEVFVGIITAIFAIGLVAENDKVKTKMLAVCLCVSMVALTVLNIA